MATEEELTLSFMTKDWKPIPKLGRVIPFGYKVNEDDPDVLDPIISELEALEKAKVHLKQYSYRRVAAWLNEVTGRYISHVGLRKRVHFEKKQKGKLNGLRKLTERAEKAKNAAEKILNSRIGAEYIYRDDNRDSGGSGPTDSSVRECAPGGDETSSI